MSANWKSWLLSSGVLCGLACGDSDQGAADSDGGDSVELSHGSVPGDGGRDASTPRDGGRDASTPRDGSTARDGSTPRDSSTPADDAGDDENCGVLMARIRDFTPETNPDFESFSGSSATKGIVDSMLDGDSLPVFKAAQGQVTSKTSFDQWYRTVSGTNMEIDIPIELNDLGGDSYGYESSAFFPIDGKGFGNYDSTGHNFHFTTQIAASFTYGGGEEFEFEGDDDLWIFVNKRLALDLGGLHSAAKGTIKFDEQAAALGIVKGETYPMDIFHAERHTDESNFKIRTTISCFKPPMLL